MSGKTKQVVIFDLGFESGKGENGLLSKMKVIKKKQDKEVIKCMESNGFLYIFAQINMTENIISCFPRHTGPATHS